MGWPESLTRRICPLVKRLPTSNDWYAAPCRWQKTRTARRLIRPPRSVGSKGPARPWPTGEPAPPDPEGGTVRLQVVLRYAAPPARVVTMLADPEFSRRVIVESEGRPVAVDVTGDPTGEGPFTVTTRRAIATDQIPPQMRSFVGATLDVRQAIAWGENQDGIRRGSVAVEIAGTPVRVTGTTHL